MDTRKIEQAVKVTKKNKQPDIVCSAHVRLLEKWLSSPLTQSSFTGKSQMKADSNFSKTDFKMYKLFQCLERISLVFVFLLFF